MAKILTVEPKHPDHEICPGCKKEVDYDTCGCGTALEYHGDPMSEGHGFIPLGCDCFRAK